MNDRKQASRFVTSGVLGCRPDCSPAMRFTYRCDLIAAAEPCGLMASNWARSIRPARIHFLSPTASNRATSWDSTWYTTPDLKSLARQVEQPAHRWTSSDRENWGAFPARSCSKSGRGTLADQDVQERLSNRFREALVVADASHKRVVWSLRATIHGIRGRRSISPKSTPTSSLFAGWNQGDWYR